MSLQNALDLHREGRLDDAESAYRACLASDPVDVDALYLLAVLSLQRGDPVKARELIDRAIELAPDLARHYLLRGATQLRVEDVAAAQASFEKALELDPNCAEAYATLGHLALGNDDTANAEARFRVGRRVDDDDPMLLLGLGNIYLSRGEATNAVKFLTRAAEVKPGDAAIQATLGHALFEQGAYAFAEKALRNAILMRSDLSFGRLILARALLRQKRLDEARVEFNALLNDNQQVFGATAGLADVARLSNRTAAALKYYRRALAIDPAHVGAVKSCVWCLEKLGDVQGAAECLEAALKQNPERDDLRQPLVQMLEKLGRHEDAAQFRQGRPTAFADN